MIIQLLINCFLAHSKVATLARFVIKLGRRMNSFLILQLLHQNLMTLINFYKKDSIIK